MAIIIDRNRGIVTFSRDPGFVKRKNPIKKTKRAERKSLALRPLENMAKNKRLRYEEELSGLVARWSHRPTMAVSLPVKKSSLNSSVFVSSALAHW